MALASLTFSISITAVVPALPEISHQLNVSLASGTLAFTGYLLASAALTPVVGHLGDVAGYRRVLIAVLVVFGVGALISGLAGNLAWLIAGRSLQGVGGAIIPLCFGIVRNTFAHPARTRAVAVISATSGLGTGVGLLSGGVLVSCTGFRSVFVLSGGLAAVSLIAVLVLVGRTGARTRPFRFDAVGAVLLTVCLVSLMGGIGQISPDIQSGIFLILSLVITASGVWVLRSRSARTYRPIIDLAVNSSSEVASVHVVTLLLAAGAFPIFVLTPVVAQLSSDHGGLGLTELDTALLLFPGCLLMMAAGTSYPWLSRKLRAGSTLMISSALALGGLAVCACFTDSGRGQAIGIYLVLTGIGLHLSSAAAFLVGHVPANMVAETSAVNALVRNVGNAIGAQASTFAIACVIGSEGSTQLALPLLYVAPAALALLGVAACTRLER